MFFVKFQPLFFSHPCLRPAVAFANLTTPKSPPQAGTLVAINGSISGVPKVTAYSNLKIISLSLSASSLTSRPESSIYAR